MLGTEIYDFLNLHENEAEKKIFAAKMFTKGPCTPDYSRFYAQGQQELCPFYM